MRPFRLLPLLLLFLSGSTPAAPVEFKPGDRLVVIGGTLIEREQRYGYWEAMLCERFPGLKVRNLGWSGDDVTGIARRAFELTDPNIGRKRLVELALAEKPSVILICYGANEAFAGEAGLADFKKGYERLLDELAPARARIILMSPPPLETKGPPLPDPADQNQRLTKYRDAIKGIAEARKLTFADLFHVMGEGQEPHTNLTDNGLHFTAEGYRQTASAFATSLGLKDASYSETMEPVREAIVRKNQLYFYKWRPQNQTYLTGFRKHEQGRNAKEVAEFDPLVAEVEADIEKLLKK